MIFQIVKNRAFRPIAPLVAGVLVAGGGVCVTAHTTDPSPARAASHASGEVGEVCFKDLPKEAHETAELIKKGGPYPHDQDGTVFQNREGILPDQDEGYYHEFTVETPGLDHRGAKRIVTGGEESDREDDYYTEDHYESFDLIDYDCGGSTPAPKDSPKDGEDESDKGGDPTAELPEGTDASRVGVTCESSLNEETHETLELIRKHADDREKFPYPDKDGSTFEWREHDKYPFPKKEDGYYLEWTVPTPGLDHRGKQRIVTGGEPSDQKEDFYTDDHYDTFDLVDYGC